MGLLIKGSHYFLLEEYLDQRILNLVTQNNPLRSLQKVFMSDIPIVQALVFLKKVPQWVLCVDKAEDLWPRVKWKDSEARLQKMREWEILGCSKPNRKSADNVVEKDSDQKKDYYYQEQGTML